MFFKEVARGIAGLSVRAGAHPLDLRSQCASSLCSHMRHLGHERETPDCRPPGDARVVTLVALSFLEYRGLYKYLCFKSPYIFAT